MYSQAKLSRRYPRDNIALSRKISPENFKEPLEQLKIKESQGFSKMHAGQFGPRLAQVQRKPSHPIVNEKNQKGNGVLLVRDDSPRTPSEDQTMPEEEDEEELEEIEEQSNAGNVTEYFRSIWTNVSKMFAVNQSSSSDDVADPDYDGCSKSRSFSLGDQMQAIPTRDTSGGASKVNVVNAAAGHRLSSDSAKSRLGKSVSHTNGMLRRGLRDKPEKDSYSWNEARRTQSNVSCKRNGMRKPRSEERLMTLPNDQISLKKREKRAKTKGSPVDAKRFRVMLKKFQRVMKEDSMKLDGQARNVHHGVKQTKSLVSDAGLGKGHPGRPSNYKSLTNTSLHKSAFERTKVNNKPLCITSPKSATCLKNERSSRLVTPNGQYRDWHVAAPLSTTSHIVSMLDAQPNPIIEAKPKPVIEVKPKPTQLFSGKFQRQDRRILYSNKPADDSIVTTLEKANEEMPEYLNESQKQGLKSEVQEGNERNSSQETVQNPSSSQLISVNSSSEV
ncbi:hypothetical protein BgiMline_009608 [Biomphalaria glabrata]|uniref:Uncharacterized protein LOC106054248 n=1 Tax=Biomphalaria glabrata TaxID=6526 RepID=A0A9U8DXC8_BIOGL|nr:uncharacterized protein LOC106054248 [Biomphalaria glabrata]KAI8740637.1 hypothetical protein BgiMline_023727 [Biomphalaria glabrata]